jgi:ubiquinone/menaquinone biosynthesis C-methylase UbiE
MAEDKNRVCPVELAGGLDSIVRRWLQNPKKILEPFLREGMTALDVGCGPGFFSIEMAKLVGKNGGVISADLQEGMLQKLRDKISGTILEDRIRLVKCDTDRIPVADKVDFILTFYMVHEVPDKERFFEQLRKILNENGKLLIVEPKLFHVSKSEFSETLGVAERKGFTAGAGPKLGLSWSAVLT